MHPRFSGNTAIIVKYTLILFENTPMTIINQEKEKIVKADRKEGAKSGNRNSCYLLVYWQIGGLITKYFADQVLCNYL